MFKLFFIWVLFVAVTYQQEDPSVDTNQSDQSNKNFDEHCKCKLKFYK